MHTDKTLSLENKTNLFVEILVLSIISWQLTVLINTVGGETKSTQHIPVLLFCTTLCNITLVPLRRRKAVHSMHFNNSREINPELPQQIGHPKQTK